jgi:DNA-binding protein HU-alpha
MPSTKTASPKAKSPAGRSAKTPAKTTTTAVRKATAPKVAPVAAPAPVRLASDLTPAPVVVPHVTVVPADAEAAPETVDEASSAVTLKKQDLLARVAALSGAKRKDVKPILEAALQVLGDALSKGEELNLPPLGKVKVNRSKAESGTEILMLRLRRSDGAEKAKKPGKEGLAQDGEDD